MLRVVSKKFIKAEISKVNIRYRKKTYLLVEIILEKYNIIAQ